MKTFRVTSPAKINVGLIIKGRQEDGYHLLESLFYPIELSDELILIPQNEPGLEIKMSGIPVEIAPGQNLCEKAWEILADKGIELPGMELHINKKIPAGAGLGGGSSNAANFLKSMNTFLDLGLGMHELHEICASLGADVPFFLYSKPMIARGIGNELQPIDIRIPYEIRLELPGLHCSTPEAYQNLDLSELDPGRSILDFLKLPVEEWKDKLPNDLETPVFRKYPELAMIKQKMYADGAIYASMSGSGSTVYGLFAKE